MATPAETLKEIHRLRRYAHDLQTKLDEMPRRLQLLRDRVAYQEEQYRQAQETIKRLKVQAKEDEVSLQALQQQIDRYARQLNDILSKKEYDALQHEIAHGKQKIGELEDKILATLTEIDERTAKLPELAQAVAAAKQELAAFEAEVQTRTAEFQKELEKTAADLATVEASLPAGDLQVQYQRLIRQRGEDAFAPVKNRTCQACYTEATSQQMNELRLGKFVMCKSCGRIIYLAE